MAILLAMIYLVLRAFAVPTLIRNPATLALIRLYILIAGAPPSAIRAGVITTFVLACALYELTTPRRSASPPQWARSRRSRWR